MSLGRVAAVAAWVALLVIVLCNASYYFVLRDQAERFHRQRVEAAARGAAAVIQARMDLLSRALELITRQPELKRLLEMDDRTRLAAEAEQIQPHLPGLLRLRFLQPDVDVPDQSERPFMGYADLEMVHRAVASDPSPAVHSYGSEHAHLAMARRIGGGERVIGVVLASFSLASIQQALAATVPEGGAFELKQGPLVIAGSGDRSLLKDGAPGQLPVPGTDWTIIFSSPPAHVYDVIPVIVTITVACVLVLLAAAFGGRRWLLAMFRHDQAVIVRAVRDLLKGRKRGNYSPRIQEIEEIVKTLFQLSHEATESMLDEIARKSDKESRHSDPVEFHSETSGIEVKSEPALPEVPASIFRASDIRGRVDETLTTETVGVIGRAVGSEVQDRGQLRVFVARDGRPSSAALSEALTQGLRDSGCDVIDLGLVPTPLLYFAARQMDSNAGVMVTGSHNPPEYNGLKIVVDGETLFGDELQAIRLRAAEGRLRMGSGSLQKRDVMTDYVGAVTEDVQIARPMKLVLDAGNGAAGPVASQLFRALGCEVVELFCDIDGRFPNHHPDPSQPDNLRDLIAAVHGEKADLGLAFDGDGDRLGVVDDRGAIIWPDRQLMLLAADVLSRHPGSDIVYDVKCSRHLAAEVVKYGGRPVMWKTGHALIKAKMKETGAMLGGEMTGHIVFGERWFGFDDALYAGARLVELLALEEAPPHSVFAALPDSVNTPELRVRLADGEPEAIMETLGRQPPFPDAKTIDIDGVRADFSDGWGLIRASNTTPDLVFRFEADNERSMAEIQARFRALLEQIKPGIACPF